MQGTLSVFPWRHLPEKWKISIIIADITPRFETETI